MPFFSTYQPHVRFYADLKFYRTLKINLNDLNGKGHYSLISPLHFSVALANVWDNDVRLPSSKLCDGQNPAFSAKMSKWLQQGQVTESLSDIVSGFISPLIKASSSCTNSENKLRRLFLTGAVLALKSSLGLNRKNSSHLFLWLLFRKLKPDFFFFF